MFNWKIKAEDVLKIIMDNKFRPFERHDWYTFAGCNSASPYICEIEIDKDHSITYIIDGDIFSVYPNSALESEEELFNEFQMFKIGEMN